MTESVEEKICPCHNPNSSFVYLACSCIGYDCCDSEIVLTGEEAMKFVEMMEKGK